MLPAGPRIAAVSRRVHLQTMRSPRSALPHVLALGASAGGIAALKTVLEGLPVGLPAAILVVQHISPNFVSHLPAILSCGGHHAESGSEGTPILSGHTYVAPPDRHMTVDEAGAIRLRASPRVHFTRPAVDALFSSIASVFGDRVIAVVLSGSGTDGTDGARAVRAHGGTVIAQSKATSEHFGMPGSVIAEGQADYVLPLSEIPQRIVELMH